MRTKEEYQVLKRLHQTEGDLAYILDVFGDYLADREGYKAASGMDAVIFFIVNKFGWPPSQVRGMSYTDLEFVLQEEMHGWSLPKVAK